MTDTKHIWHSRYYMILRFYLSLSGIWPYHNLRNQCIRFVPMLTFCSGILIPQLFYFFNGPISLDDIFECVPQIFISSVMGFKLSYIMFNIDKVKICLNMIEKDWLSLNEAEKAILVRHTEYGRYITTVYAVFMHTLACLFLLKPIMLTVLSEDTVNVTKSSITTASKLPFRVEYGKRFDQYLYPITIHCYGAIFAHSFVIIATDALYSSLIQHACGMFSIVGYVLENVGKNGDVNFDLNLKKIKDDNYMKVLDCLRRHLHVIEFAELIESLYTKIFLVNVNINMIGGSLAGIQILMSLEGSAKDIAGPVTIYIAQLLHLFLHFWQAQFLLDYSALPYESVCRANWYYTSKRCRKLFLLIMNRTTLPCTMTAGKLMTLSIENFGVVVKTSLSYLAVFRSFRQ
ncbi:odorant receptor 13a-like isoform X2 [Linepithema humile]|uniref:odorant receptor 13a-like isoform X2 n=1 Tax=Linepithema humile TaxID=83485 RepID=UPI00351E05B3